MTDVDESLGLREVQERFAASAAALEAVKSRLDALGSLHDTQAATTESLSAAAKRLEEFATTAGEAVAALSSSQQAAVSAFSSMQHVMDGSDLHELREAVNALSARVADGEESARTAAEAAARERQALLEAVAELRREVGDAQQARGERDAAAAALSELRAQFESLKAAAGSRAMRKAGLQDAGSPPSPLGLG